MSNNRRKNRQNFPPKLSPRPISIRQSRKPLERRTSSPAAPPPSFSDRAYRPRTSDTSTDNFKKDDSFLTNPANAGFLSQKNFRSRLIGLWRHILALTSSQSVALSEIIGASRGGRTGYAGARIYPCALPSPILPMDLTPVCERCTSSRNVSPARIRQEKSGAPSSE
jgi:hypothetical protein